MCLQLARGRQPGLLLVWRALRQPHSQEAAWPGLWGPQHVSGSTFAEWFPSFINELLAAAL